MQSSRWIKRRSLQAAAIHLDPTSYAALQLLYNHLKVHPVTPMLFWSKKWHLTAYHCFRHMLKKTQRGVNTWQRFACFLRPQVLCDMSQRHQATRLAKLITNMDYIKTSGEEVNLVYFSYSVTTCCCGANSGMAPAIAGPGAQLYLLYVG